MQHHLKRARLCSAIGALLIASTAYANDQPGAQDGSDEPNSQMSDADQEGRDQSGGGSGAVRQLESVTVTARKREESLQDAPVAMTALSRAALENHLATDMTKMAEIAPQVSIAQSGSSTGAAITVRGVSTGGSDAGMDQSVAIEVDGVPVSRGEVVASSLFDMEQVQILQGPQALFFGKNSPAGVISLKSADPSDSFESYFTTGYEFEHSTTYVEGAVSGPLSPTFMARLAVRFSKRRDGWLKNNSVAEAYPLPAIYDGVTPGATHGDTGPKEEVDAVRLTLLWEPNESFSANLKIQHNQQWKNAGISANSEGFCAEGVSSPAVGGVVIPGADCVANRLVSHGAVAPAFMQGLPESISNNGLPYLDSDFTLTALTLDKSWGNFDLVSTTGYFDQTQKTLTVSDWSTWATIWAVDDHTYNLFTQELRFSSNFEGPFNFMVGGYYENYERGFWNAVNLFQAFNPIAQNYLSSIIDADTSGQYKSFFGQFTWDIADDWELSMGARYSDDRKTTLLVNEFVAEVGTYSTPGFLRPQGDVMSSTYTDSHISPEATLTWHPAEDQTLYLAYKTGYKSGSISVPFLLYAEPRNTAQNMQFRPEETAGFELGYKAQIADRLRFDLAAYRYNYDDLQVVSYDGTTITFTTTNAAAARIEGLQGSFDWLATDTLMLRGNFGYNRARYSSFPNSQCYAGQTEETGCTVLNGIRTQDLTGMPLLRAPELTLALGAEWSPYVSGDYMPTFSVNVSHSDGFWTAGDYAPLSWQRSYWLVNAAVRVAVGYNWEFALMGRNLTDSNYMLTSLAWSGGDAATQQVGQFQTPREMALQATWTF